MTGNRGFCAILIGEMKALELMKTHVVKTTLHATLAQAVDLMDLYYVTCLPVVDEAERICGLLSDQEILEAVRQATLDTAAADPVGTRAGSRRVSEFMRTDVLTAGEQDDVSQLVPAFLAGAAERVPVHDEAGRVTGMLHRVDVLQAIFERQLDLDQAVA